MFKKITFVVCMASSLALFSIAQAEPVMMPLSTAQIQFLAEASNALLRVDKKTGEALLPVLQQRAQEIGVGKLFEMPLNLRNSPNQCTAAMDAFKPLFSQGLDAMKAKSLPATATIKGATGGFATAFGAAANAAAAPIYADGCSMAVAIGIQLAQTAFSTAIMGYIAAGNNEPVATLR